MANTNDLISTLKKEINSILVSAGAEITLRQLEVDYRDLVGKSIPYREAGHTSLEELILSIPDAVMARWWNGDLKLRAITNICNERVAKLVSLAKNKPKTSFRPNRKTPLLGSYPQQPPLSNMTTQNNMVSVRATNGTTAGSKASLLGPYPQPLLSNMTTRNSMVSVKTNLTTAESKTSLLGPYPQQPPLSNMTTRNNTVSVKPNLTTVGSNADYNMLRGEILNLMLGYRYGLPGSKFADAFAKRYGNYRKLTDSGFPNILAMLQSMPDVVDIEYHGNSTDFTVRGKLGQRKPNGSGTNLFAHGGFPYNGNGVANGLKENKKNCNNVDVNPEVPGSLGKYVNGEKNQQTEIPYDDEEGSENWDEELNEKVHGDVKSNIQKVLSMHPNGLYASKFIAEYKKLHGTELVVKKFGYQTVIELVAELPEIAVIERPANGDWLVFDKRTYRKELINQVLQSKGQYLPPTPNLFDFRNSLRMVLETNQGGVDLKDLEVIYEKCIHQSIIPRHLGFQDLDRLLESVNDMAEIEYIGAGCAMVKLVKISNGNQKIGKADLSLAPFLPTAHGNLPKDVAVDGHCYARQDLPEPLPKYLEVVVSEVRDPSHFWFQLLMKQPLLDRLMDNLQTFYRHPSGKNYVIPDEMMKVGLVCVGQYPCNQQWHRCVILELTDERPKVSYVDYGTEGLVSKESLRLITLPLLSALPAQAIVGRLSKIAPIGESWTQAAYICFFNRVLDRELAARVTSISKDEFLFQLTETSPPFTVSLCLCDTSGKDDEYDIHINEYLIEEQHAILCVDKSQEDDAVADEEDVGAAAAVDEYIVCNGEEDYDEYEFSSSESEMELKVVNSEPDGANASQPHATRATETARGPGSLFKFVQLTPEYRFHLINIDEKAYVISSEVSSFFWEEEEDLIRPLLRNQGKANISKVVLTEDEHGEILRQLFDAMLPGTSRNGMPSQMVVLYELSSVIEILELFNHSSEALKLAVKQQLDLFNSQDSFWMEKKEPEADNQSSDLEQDLQQALNDLHKKRDCALRQIKNTSPCETARLVEEIEDIEEQQETLKTRFRQLTNREPASELSFGSPQVPSADHVSQRDQLDLNQNRAESSSAPWSIHSSGYFFGHSSSPSRSLLSTTNEEPSHAVLNNSSHLPATSLPVSAVRVSNLGGNSSSSLSVPDQASLSSSVHSSRICSQPSSNHEYANALAPSMALMSLGGIQTRAPSFAAAASLPSSGATSLTYSADYQVPINNGLVSNLPLILNNSTIPGFNPLHYNPLLLGSMPYPSAGPCYVPGPYHTNGLLPTPGLLPSLSIYTRMANGGFPSGLVLPNTFFAGNPNMRNVPH